ncbi:MAG: hypothetical protein AAB577_02240 [Patescibacteria group bacterium]
MKKGDIPIIALVILVVLIASALVLTIEKNVDLGKNLEAANRAVLDEANFSQRLQKTIRELRGQNNKLNTELIKNRSALNQAQAKLDRSVIIGKIYADTHFPYGGQDNGDTLITGEITGLSVVLYAEVPVPGNKGSQTVIVATATIKDGEYHFNVKPGKYFVSAIYGNNQLYYQRYNNVFLIGENGFTEVKKGDTIQGPTILLTNTWDERG